MDLTDAQWDILGEVFVEPRRVDGKGRPPGEGRAVWNGALWILRTGAPLEGLTRSLSTLSNLSPAFSEMAEGRSFRSDFTGAGRGCSAAGKARPERRSHRRLLRGSEKGGSAVGKTKRGKGTKIMAVTDGLGVPVVVHVASPSPHETRLLEATLDNHFAPQLPKNCWATWLMRAIL